MSEPFSLCIRRMPPKVAESVTAGALKQMSIGGETTAVVLISNARLIPESEKPPGREPAWSLGIAVTFVIPGLLTPAKVRVAGPVRTVTFVPEEVDAPRTAELFALPKLFSG